MTNITEKSNVTMRVSAISGIVGFIVWATYSISGFIAEVRAFQGATTITLNSNAAEIFSVKKDIELIKHDLAGVRTRQDNVIGDRWKFSDQLPWSYELERANRDVMRKDGTEGLSVPKPSQGKPPGGN